MSQYWDNKIIIYAPGMYGPLIRNHGHSSVLAIHRSYQGIEHLKMAASNWKILGLLCLLVPITVAINQVMQSETALVSEEKRALSVNHRIWTRLWLHHSMNHSLWCIDYWFSIMGLFYWYNFQCLIKNYFRLEENPENISYNMENFRLCKLSNKIIEIYSCKTNTDAIISFEYPDGHLIHDHYNHIEVI